jgi:ribosomal protein S18 acetylase RimI-like enzyme
MSMVNLTNDITIRLARPTGDDLDLIEPLFDQYRQHFGSAPDPGGARCFLEDRLHAGQSTVLLALAAGDADRPAAALGFVQLYPSFSSLAMAPIWVLNDLFVAPAARRQGVGRALMTAARAHAHASGAVRVILETGQSNLPAQTLYQDLGYRCENEAVRFYALELA